MGAAHSQVHFPPGAAPRVRYGHTNVHTHMQTHARTDTHTHTHTYTLTVSLHMMLIPLLQRFLQITDAELTLFDENLEASLPEITSALSQVQK